MGSDCVRPGRVPVCQFDLNAAGLSNRLCFTHHPVLIQIGFNPRVPCGTRRPEIDGQSGFNPRVPCGTRRGELREPIEFQSTRPVRDATIRPLMRTRRIKVSIHASRAGRDGWTSSLALFQSTRPVRDATEPRSSIAGIVSIHASRAGRDSTQYRTTRYGVSIHASRAGRDDGPICKNEFQSTRPVRDATRAARHCQDCFNPRVPCGTRLCRDRLEREICRVSIHASRAGRDVVGHPVGLQQRGFNPRVPCGTRRPHYKLLRDLHKDWPNREPLGIPPGLDLKIGSPLQMVKEHPKFS